MASERLLIERLKSTFKSDQTVIVTTHRSSMLALVRRLVVIDRGKLVADGPRDEVLAMLTRSTHGESTEAPIKRSNQDEEPKVRAEQADGDQAESSNTPAVTG